jgi:hypothetical protein
LGVEFPLPAYAIRALLLHGIGDWSTEQISKKAKRSLWSLRVVT